MVRSSPRLHSALAVVALSVAALGMVAAGVELGQGSLIGDRQAPDAIETRPAARIVPPRRDVVEPIEVESDTVAGSSSEPAQDPQPAPAPGASADGRSGGRSDAGDGADSGAGSPSPGPPAPAPGLLPPTPDPAPGVVDPIVDPVSGLIDGLLGVPGAATAPLEVTTDPDADANETGESPVSLLRPLVTLTLGLLGPR